MFLNGYQTQTCLYHKPINPETITFSKICGNSEREFYEIYRSWFKPYFELQKHAFCAKWTDEVGFPLVFIYIYFVFTYMILCIVWVVTEAEESTGDTRSLSWFLRVLGTELRSFVSVSSVLNHRDISTAYRSVKKKNQRKNASNEKKISIST